MGEIPVDSCFEAGGKRFARSPSQLSLKLGAVDRVPTVVPRAIGDMSNLNGVGLAVGTRAFPVQQCADGLHDLDVGLLTQAADVVRLAATALAQDEPDRGGMIFDVKPVADLPAIAVDRQRFPLD